MKNKDKFYNIKISDSDKEVIHAIKSLTGTLMTSEVFRRAIRVYRDQLEPLYVRTKSQQTKRATYETPEDRVKAQIEKKKQDDEAKRAVLTEQALHICELLDGEIIEQEGGSACKYRLYEKVGKRIIEGSRTVPFENLHESLIETQYKGGTKAEILELLASKN